MPAAQLSAALLDAANPRALAPQAEPRSAEDASAGAETGPNVSAMHAYGSEYKYAERPITDVEAAALAAARAAVSAARLVGFSAADALASLPPFPVDAIIPGLNAVITGPSKSGKTTLGRSLLAKAAAAYSGGVYMPATPLQQPSYISVAAMNSGAPIGYLAEITVESLQAARPEDATDLKAAIAIAFKLRGSLTTVLTTDANFLVPRSAAVPGPTIARFILPGSTHADLINAWKSSFSAYKKPFSTMDEFFAVAAALPPYTALVQWCVGAGPSLFTFKADA